MAKQFELNDPAVINAPPVEGPTITAGELVARLSLLNADTPVIGYSDRMDYVNITDVHYAPDEGPAAVLEITNSYDSRQW